MTQTHIPVKVKINSSTKSLMNNKKVTFIKFSSYRIRPITGLRSARSAEFVQQHNSIAY